MPLTIISAPRHVTPRGLSENPAKDAENRASIQAAFDKAGGDSSVDGRQNKVIIPEGVFCADDQLNPRDNTEVESRAHLKFTGGDAIGGFYIGRSVSNTDTHGGTWDSNEQGNDNTIAFGNVNPNQTVAAPGVCKNNHIHDLTVVGCRHGGSHIADDTLPADVGHGGGKGVTVQFGCEDTQIYNLLVDDCDLGVSVEGKEANQGGCPSTTISDTIIKNCRYMGLFLTSVPNTPSLYGQTTSLLLNNVELVDCGIGQTLEVVPQDIATLFAAIVTQGMIGVKANNLRVRSTDGKLTVFRGAQRFCEWDLQVLCAGTLVDLINTAPYAGHNPSNLGSRYLEMLASVAYRLDAAEAFTGYLVNSDTTYPANFSTFRVGALNYNNGAVASVPTAQYAANFPADSTLEVKDRHTGRLMMANDGTPVDATASWAKTFINGLAIDDDPVNDFTKIGATRGKFGLADPSGGTYVRVESGVVILPAGAGLNSSTRGLWPNAGNPNGSLTKANGSLCIDTTNGIVYKKASGGLSNTGWVELATTADITAAINALVNAAPGTLDTLGEIATQLASDESAAAALATTVAGKLAIASNLSDLANAVTARSNLGLGDAATHPASDFATAAAVIAAQATADAALPKAQLRFYRQLLAAAAAATTAAASGTKYLARGGSDSTTITTAVATAALYPLTAADHAVSGLTTKLRVASVLKTGTAPAVTITVGLYPLTSGATSSAGTVVPGSTVTFASPAANSEPSGNSGDFDLPADGVYALGYTVSGTPGGAFSVQAMLQARNV